MNEYEEIRSKLVERREKLAHLLGRVERSARRKLDKSFEEQAIQRESEEVLNSLDKALNDELMQIENALRRFERGEYGTCEDCGRKISVKRLEALPHATLCIKCAI